MEYVATSTSCLFRVVARGMVFDKPKGPWGNLKTHELAVTRSQQVWDVDSWMEEYKR